MDDLFLQLQVLLISLLGVIAFIPGPNKEGELRIKGPLNNIISYLGIALMLGPWIVAPFLEQPRFTAWAHTPMKIIGALCLVAGVLLYGYSFKELIRAFREQFNEFTPEKLIQTGPYRIVRHPIYLSSIVILSGLMIFMRASFSILYLPFSVIIFRAVTIYEERKILLPRFPEQYKEYRSKVPSAILGGWGSVVFVIAYLILSIPTLLDLMNIVSFTFIQ